MQRLTDEQLDEIKKRAEAITEGKWRYYPIVASNEFVVIGEDMVAETVYEKADAEFIAAAKQDIPKLLAEIERLKAYEKIFSQPVDLSVTDKHGIVAKIYGASIGKLEVNSGDNEKA